MPRRLASAAIICFLTVSWAVSEELPRHRAPWIAVSTANFELYTTAGEDAGRNLVMRLERLRAILQPAMCWRGEVRGDMRDERERSICIIAFGSRDEFQPYAPISRSVGFFLPGFHRDFMVLDGASAENRSAAHELVHLVMSRSGYWLPPWLNEGLAELYSNVEVGRSEPDLALGRIIPGRVQTLQRAAWIGLDGLLAALPQSEYFSSPTLVDSSYAESWLLAHMLVLDPRYAPRFPQLLEALQDVDSARAFRRVYDKSVAQVECDLKTYLDDAQQNIRRLGNPPELTGLHIGVERDADFAGRMALAEMLRGYRGRTEESRDLYRQLERDYPERF